MSKKTGLKQIAITSLLLGANTLVFADDDLSSFAEVVINDNFLPAEIAARDSSKDTKKQKSNKDKKNQEQAPALGDKNPPYNNPNRFVLQGSFIYWRADVDGIDPSLEGNTTIDNSGSATIPETRSTTNKLKIKDLNFKWDPGFKTGIGVIFGEMDEWDLFLNWTWLQSKANRTQGSDTPFSNISTFPTTAPVFGSEDYLNSPFSVNVIRSPMVQSKTSWKLQYNTVDLDLGRNFYLASNLTIRPFAGLRGAFLHQTTNVKYTENSFNTTHTDQTLGTNQFKGKNDYNAVGLRGGFDINWNFTNHFCVYSTLSGGILFGNFNVKETFTIDDFTVSTATSAVTIITTETTNLKGNYHRTRSTLQAILGLMWHTDFNNDKQHLFVSAGYEVNQWFQQNELRSVDTVNSAFDFEASRTSGDLGLHGLTVDLRFDF